MKSLGHWSRIVLAVQSLAGAAYATEVSSPTLSTETQPASSASTAVAATGISGDTAPQPPFVVLVPSPANPNSSEQPSPITSKIPAPARQPVGMVEPDFAVVGSGVACPEAECIQAGGAEVGNGSTAALKCKALSR